MTDAVDKTILAPIHIDFDSAHVTDDYPYGYTLRTQRKMWIESKPKFGQRVVTCTKNPKTGNWNKPKRGTYSEICVLFIEAETGHVKNDGVNKYNIVNRAGDFLSQYHQGLTQKQQDKLVVFSAANHVQEVDNIRLATHGRLAFYTRLNNVLTEWEREDLIKIKPKQEA